MSITMLEKQIVDGVVVEMGELVTSDEFTENTLVAHGKAVFTEPLKQPELPATGKDSKKGGSE